MLGDADCGGGGEDAEYDAVSFLRAEDVLEECER